MSLPRALRRIQRARYFLESGGDGTRTGGVCYSLAVAYGTLLAVERDIGSALGEAPPAPPKRCRFCRATEHYGDRCPRRPR